MNNHRPYRRLILNVQSTAGAVIAVGIILGAIYALWPVPKQVNANADEIDRHYKEEYHPFKESVDDFIQESRVATAEQRVMINSQKNAADQTQTTMKLLIDAIKSAKP